MTVEHRFIAGLKDIRAVTFECKKCSARLSVEPDKMGTTTFANCPSCNQEWFDLETGDGRALVSPMAALVRSLVKSREMQEQKSVGVRILLEFDDPTSGAGLASAL
jgi:transcription elongation factor Elf1